MTNKEYYIGVYEKRDKLSLMSDWNVMELVGYYLSEHIDNEIQKLNLDIASGLVSTTKGQNAKLVLMCI